MPDTIDPTNLPRERDLLRYLEAYSSQFVDHTTQPSLNKTPPRSSQDTSLTAFAQLGALRLNASRVIISLVSRQWQYVLAEATRTLSLQSDDVHDARDALWLGCSVMPTQAGICGYAVSQGGGRKHSTEKADYRRPILVVNDLRDDERFKNSKSTVGFPYLRFYAGIPLVSQSSGKTVGSYCVLDTEPRENGLDDASLQFLKDMAVTVISHLELARARLEQRRSEKMVRGIGACIEGKTSIREWLAQKKTTLASNPSANFLPAEGDVNSPENEDRTLVEAGLLANFGQVPLISHALVQETTTGYVKTTRNLTRSNTPGERVNRSSTQVKSTRFPPQVNIAQSPMMSQRQPGIGRSDGFYSSLRATSIKSLFSRASNLIREATEVEGVLFLDARGADAKVTEENESHASDLMTSTGEESGMSQGEDGSDMCSVLGFSTTESSSINASVPSSQQLSIDQKFLRALLRRYPHGKVFSIEESSSDSGSGSAVSDTASADSKLGFSYSKTRRRRVSRKAEISHISGIFQGARSLAFFPLWNVEKQQWYAGAVAYTNQPMRELTVEGELSYLAAFGNSIMAEVARMDLLRSDRAKADFISSISHELRSPLHGILGSVDLLEIDGQHANDLMRNIETCGRSLLDTINHLLDHSKINNFLRSGGKKANYRRSIGRAKSAQDGMMMLESNLDLALLTEETFQTVCAGHHYASTDRKAAPVSLTLDIEQSASYMFHAEAGALRRVLMNLCGNALKYTDSGFVNVTLRAPKPQAPDSSQQEVVLLISDSGKGISTTYQRDSLFTPFTQQDPHSTGTGLGLSIVKSIVTSLNGKLHIQSEEGVGTTVTVTLKLPRVKSTADGDWQKNRDRVKEILKLSKGEHVSISLPEAVSDNADKTKFQLAASLHLQNLKTLCASWFRMRSATPGSEPEISLTAISSVDELKEDRFTSRKSFFNTPVIIICPDASTALDVIQHSGRLGQSNVYAVAQPLGPLRLANVLWRIFDNSAASTGQVLTGATDARSPIARTSSTPVNSPATVSTFKGSCHGEMQLDPKGTDAGQVLLVDDNPINLNLLVAFMRKLGIKYGTATNGLQAFEAYKAQAAPRFQHILMDISMPVMDGIQSTREIRKYEEHNGIHPPCSITALTGLASAQAQQDAFQSGINLFLTKPVKMTELKRVLERRE